MAVTDRFDGAKNGFSAFFGFYSTVAREIGTDRALALYAKAQEVGGVALGKKVKEQAENSGIRRQGGEFAS